MWYCEKKKNCHCEYDIVKGKTLWGKMGNAHFEISNRHPNRDVK